MFFARENLFDFTRSQVRICRSRLSDCPDLPDFTHCRFWFSHTMKPVIIFMPANEIPLLLIGLAILSLLGLIWRRISLSPASSPQSAQVSHRLETLDQGLSKKFTELAIQLEKTRGELNLEIIKQFSVGLSSVRSAVDAQL